ncbi:MAG: DivIVA domain-containing protein [Clostridia bacterium]|nr:DivIVA domain-containing protein [Clostridia bacterium]
MLSIEEIKNISFRKAGIGGYKPEDVDAFIDQVLITMEQLRKEKSDLVKKMDILATRVEEYRADEDAVRNALLSAQRVADTTIKESRAKAAYIIEESENLAKAKLYDLNVQIKQQKKQYALLLAECNRIRDEIISNCNKHIVIAKELPSVDKIKTMEAAIDERFPTDNSNDYERAGEVASTFHREPSVKRNVADSPVSEQAVVSSSANAEKNNNTPAEKTTPQPEPKQTESAPVVAEEAYETINIVSDIEPRDSDVKIKKDKKKGRAFGVLKFGDDYDLNNDNDDGDAESDNT